MASHMCSFILLFTLFASLCGFGNAQAYVPFDNTNIQYIGRSTNWNITNGGSVYKGRAFDWPGVTVSTRITGSTKLSVHMALFQSSTPIAFNAIIDGVVYKKFDVSSYKVSAEIVLSTTLTTGVHTVDIVRLTEATYGGTVFYGFGLSAAGLITTPLTRPNRRIEFIGDSITCGYGNLGAPGCVGNNPQIEDNYRAHGAATARLLGADYQITAWSGRGMVRNVHSNATSSSGVIPDLYNKTLGNTVNSPIWKYTSWVPHAIFINLGTNDFSGSSAYIKPSPSQYINGYVSFVNRLKTLYVPTPKFFFACGPMTSVYCPYLKNVSAAVSGSTIINYYDLKINYSGRGCDGHPNVATDTNMANAQAPIIKSVMGW